MNPTVYLETTIPSYLVARPSSDPVVASRQQATRQWWTSASSRFDLFVSQFVLREIRGGDEGYAARRIEAIQDTPVLAFNEDVKLLIRLYQQRLGLQGKVRSDVPHFAYAVSYEVDYLLTWNCSHIANHLVTRRLTEINLELGRRTPAIATPEDMIEREATHEK